MTVDEFCKRADEILIERDYLLKEWQVADIELYKRVVRRQGRVMEIDEYYLSFVGLPSSGKVVKPRKPIGERIIAKQGGLF